MGITDGADALAGATGNDALWGQTGADQFVFNTALNGTANVDTIKDFASIEGDKIVFDSSIFTALTAGALPDAAFWTVATGGAAHDADDRVIYNSATGGLYYDHDGRGGDAAVRVGTLTNADTTHPVVTHNDFLIV